MVLPIIALVIAIRSKRKLTTQISKLEAALGVSVRDDLQRSPMPGDGGALEHLQARVTRLEAALESHSILVPRAPSGTD